MVLCSGIVAFCKLISVLLCIEYVCCYISVCGYRMFHCLLVYQLEPVLSIQVLCGNTFPLRVGDLVPLVG